MQMRGECSAARGDPRLGWCGASLDPWLALLLEFQGLQQAPQQAPACWNAGAWGRCREAALASWVLSSSDPQERPLRSPDLPLRPRDGASAHWPVISLGPGFPGASISHPQMRQRSERPGGREERKSRSEGLLLQPEDLRPPARAPGVAPDP